MSISKEIKRIKEHILNMDEDEFFKVLKDCGFKPEEESEEEVCIDIEKIIDEIYNIVLELDARESGGNLLFTGLQDKSWTELCEYGIELLEQIR